MGHLGLSPTDQVGKGWVPDKLGPVWGSFCASQEISKRIKRQDTDWENVFVIHRSSKNISEDRNEVKNSYRLMRKIQ